MKRNNKKGFTLIEIIITLGLILLITGVAIGSFVGITKQKKKEEWALVKGQIETAAEQYFSSNKYLFESFSSDGINGTISVGKLVEEGYISKIINPITDQAVSDCSVVTVIIKNGKYNGTYNEEDISKQGKKCDTQNVIVLSENGAPKISVETTCENEGNDSWCKGDEKITLNIDKKNGSIFSKKYCQSNGFSCTPNNNLGNNNTIKDTEEGQTRTTKFEVKNNRGTTLVYTTYKIDKTPPSAEIFVRTGDVYVGKSIYNNMWVYDIDDKPVSVVKPTDNLSGISSVKRIYGNNDKIAGTSQNANNEYIFSLAEGEYFPDKYEVEDKAGNKKEFSNEFVVSSKPTCPEFDLSGIEGDNGYYVSDVDVFADVAEEGDRFYSNVSRNGNYYMQDAYNPMQAVANDSNSYIWKMTEDGTINVTGYSTNKYGLSNAPNSCGISFNVDKTPPSCPGIGYVFVSKESIDVDNTGACYMDENGVSWRCWYNKDKGGIDNSAIALYVNPSVDTSYWNWYTTSDEAKDYTAGGVYENTQGTVAWDYNNWQFNKEFYKDGVYIGSDITTKFINEVDMFRYHSTNVGVQRKTLSGHNVLFADISETKTSGTTTQTINKYYYTRAGIVEAFDAAGNRSICPTMYVLMKSTKKSTETKPKVKPPAKQVDNYCTTSGFKQISKNNVGNFVKVDLVPEVNGSSWGTVWAAPGSGSKVTFKYTRQNSHITLEDDASAVWSTRKKTKTSHHTGWNNNKLKNSVEKNTWCDTNYACMNSNYKHVTSCITAICKDDKGSYSKKVCYYVNASNGEGKEFSNLK